LAKLAFVLFSYATLLPLAVALGRESTEPPFDLPTPRDLRRQATPQLANQLGSYLLRNPDFVLGGRVRHMLRGDDCFAEHFVQTGDRLVAGD